MNSKISFIHAPTNFKTPGSVQVIIVINEMKLIFVLWLKQNVDGNTTCILTQNWELLILNNMQKSTILHILVLLYKKKIK